jgi:hypothetical protein
MRTTANTRLGTYAVIRRVLVVLWAVVLIAFLPASQLGSSSVAASLWGDDAPCDCCPDQAPDEGEDCCDTEGGLCCVTSTAGALPALGAPRPEAPSPLAERLASLPAHLLIPRANDPPPTRPPIV